MAYDQPLEIMDGALDRAEPAPNEADYEFFCTTVMATARGRGFLAEYVRRHRNADTQAVLTALRRIETMVRASSASSLPGNAELDHIRDGLHDLAARVREARHDLGGGALSAASQVMALLKLLEARIEALIEPAVEAAAKPVAVAIEARPERAHLTVVEPPVVVLSPSAALLPPLGPADSAAPLAIVARKFVAPLQVLPRSVPPREQPAPEPPSVQDRFADVMALSEDERIALFS